MINSAWRHLLRILLPLVTVTLVASETTAAAQTLTPQLEIDRAEAFPGTSVTLTGNGYYRCTPRSPVGALSLDSFHVDTQPNDIEFLPVAITGGPFQVEGTVSADAAPGQHKITVSCANRQTREPLTLTDSVELTVVVDPEPDQPNPDPSDPVGNVDSPAAGTDARPTLPTGGASSAWLPLVGVALLLSLLLLGGRAVQRRQLGRPRKVDVRPVAGAVLGPRVSPIPLELDGVRIVPHADPGTRALSRPGRRGRSSSWR